MGRKKRPVDYITILKTLSENKITEGAMSPKLKEECELLPLDKRVELIFSIAKSSKINAGNMMFFVMYDVENDRTRRYIVKYLERQGCVRIQKSIFLANLPIETFNEIKADLEAVQSVYENEDSILVVPITSEYLNSMKVIGQSINVDVITHTRSTVFF